MSEITTSVLDIYGNNAAVRCSSCQQAFVISAHINAKNGRICPHCGKSKAMVDGQTYTVVPHAPTETLS
jgi:Zn finger protein HypA/HybF involved in hydrogenase expression